MAGPVRVCSFLDMGVGQRSIIDAVTATSIDADIVRRAMVRHESGIDLLLAPPTPEAAELVSSEQHHLLRTVEMLKTMYDYVIVDLDNRLDDNMLDIVGAADRLVVVMTADLSCLKNVSSLNSGTPFVLKRPESALSRGVVEFARLVDGHTTAAVERGKFEMVSCSRLKRRSCDHLRMRH